MIYFDFKPDKKAEKRIEKEEKRIKMEAKARKLQNRAEAAQRLNKRGKWV